MATATAVRSKPSAADVGRARAQVNQLVPFQWVGTDKRGKKLKGEYSAKTAALVKAELRRQGINPTSVKPKSQAVVRRRGTRNQGA